MDVRSSDSARSRPLRSRMLPRGGKRHGPDTLTHAQRRVAIVVKPLTSRAGRHDHERRSRARRRPSGAPADRSASAGLVPAHRPFGHDRLRAPRRHRPANSASVPPIAGGRSVTSARGVVAGRRQSSHGRWRRVHVGDLNRRDHPKPFLCFSDDAFRRFELRNLVAELGVRGLRLPGALRRAGRACLVLREHDVRGGDTEEQRDAEEQRHDDDSATHAGDADAGDGRCSRPRRARPESCADHPGRATITPPPHRRGARTARKRALSARWLRRARRPRACERHG